MHSLAMNTMQYKVNTMVKWKRTKRQWWTKQYREN